MSFSTPATTGWYWSTMSSHTAHTTAYGPCASSSGLALEAVPDRGEVGVLGVPDGDDVVGADEDVHLAELDRLGVVEVARGLQHEERHVAVALELRALMALRARLRRRADAGPSTCAISRISSASGR